VVSARWADPDGLDVTLRIRAKGVQFANDLNTFKLPGYATVDLYVARDLRELMKNVKAFVAVTNLFDKQIITGKNQTVTNIGAPLTDADEPATDRPPYVCKPIGVCLLRPWRLRRQSSPVGLAA
jgi:outer membrane receptor protein involved in Fe transport